MKRPLHRSVAALTAAAMLAGCVSTREGRIGTDDGSDACRAQLVALDSTGNFYAEDIIRGAAVGAVSGAVLGGLIGAATGRGRASNIATGAAIGGVAGGVAGAAGGYFAARQRQAQDQAALTAAIGGDLASENAQLDRTQVAFDQLMDCRYATAQRIRQDVRGGRLTLTQGQALMADLRGRVQRDVALARQINQKIDERGQQFDVAIENVAPGTKQQLTARVGQPVPVRTRAPVQIRLRPDPAAPEIARVAANESVTVRPAQGNFALVETSSGLRGYAPAAAVGSRGLGATYAQGGTQAGGDFRQLAASNIARRDNFTESVTNAERLAQGQGFELAAS